MAKVPAAGTLTGFPAFNAAVQLAHLFGSTPITLQFGFRFLTAFATPAINPPPPTGTMTADGLAVTTVGTNAFQVAHSLIDQVITVSESSVAVSILRLLELESFVVEGGGATAIAGFIDGKLDHLKGKNVGVILCGGNIDMPVLGRVIERGLTADGRIHRFVASVSDRPGGIAHLTDLIAKCGCSVKDLYHERASVLEDVAVVSITATVETRDTEHAKELQNMLEQENIAYKWG